MGFENNIEMLSLAFWQVLKLAGPVLLVALLIGLIIGIIQALQPRSESCIQSQHFHHCLNRVLHFFL